MSEKIEFVERATKSGANVAALCAALVEPAAWKGASSLMLSRLPAGALAGSAAALAAPALLPPGTGLGLLHHVLTGEPGSRTNIALERRTMFRFTIGRTF